MSGTKLPFVSIVVPMLNEERYVADCLTSLLSQGAAWADGSSFEILVMDGGSTDRTREIVAALQKTNPVIRMVHNSKRLQSAAMNLAGRIASPRATILLRADAHAVYAPDFLADCVNALIDTGAVSVVVPMETKGEVGFQHAVAAAQNSLLGNGGSAHRRASSSHYVEHGHHAAFNRRFFVGIGGYNETFTHNEDAEYDHRVSLAGGAIWMCGEVMFSYFPRRDPWGLAKQYFFHGAGRARTLLTHHIRPRLRQILPLLMLLGSIGGLLLAPVHVGFALIPLAYCLICIGYGVAETVCRRDPWLLAMGPAAMIMHLSWATGFIWRCLVTMRPQLPRRGHQVARLVSMATPVQDGATSG
jgi:succinoglycan biosynthesis protein ExoA